MLADEAFERYYKEIRPGLLRFISSRVRDPHAARDLVQEVYAKAFRHRDRYDPKRPFTTWIYTIARNSCVDYLRRRVLNIPRKISYGFLILSMINFTVI